MNTDYQQARLTRDPRFDGTFFVAVKTTNIFCRSICPANAPLEKNVEYFQLAQQAMSAGYRPCLRCRPDSAPHSFAWQGVNTTVHRAMGLLRQHKELNIQEIAIKLGITTRYFRQLFQQHIGLSPKQYQLFDKVLFAKQLLHQTSLPIEHIAHASGFASARRLQQNFKKVTGLTPQQLKQGKHKQEQLIRLKLAFRPPFNWSHMRSFLALRAIQGVESVTENSYSRTIVIGSDKGWFRVTAIQEQHYLQLEISLPKIEKLTAALSNIERIFDLNADTQTIQTQLIGCGLPSETMVTGLRIPGVWDTFEAGCRAILGQQISVKAAITLLTQLTNELGETQGDMRYFPTAKAIVESDLAFLKMPNSRKQTLRLFAQHSLHSSETSVDDWLTIKGIGPWTVAYAKMRGQSCPDIWLNTDLIIKKQLTQRNINAELARPWRSYLTLQLWSMS
ncbi:AlkA N-terminal domain-containing protein [uncultured Paraglaciecola sp.]|uniref:AlkA N-terminal domain-containing protein n=1 Tax=uncultured Paraglaciecola sp. TaxID=1765024 RepID=UPI0030D7FEB0|tara:strand:+ start:154162 stop:155505 length:1344 start_codon:yes stop_codon:yes gene_type:complete